MVRPICDEGDDLVGIIKKSRTNAESYLHCCHSLNLLPHRDAF